MREVVVNGQVQEGQMIRLAAVVVLALALNPALLRAQDTVLTVNVLSADVHMGPSTVNPIIGHVSRGTVLPVTRNLGSWVKVDWPAAPDGVGYVHVTMGRIGPANADAPRPNASPQAFSAPAPVTTTIPRLGRTSVGEQVVPRSQLNVTPASHVFGVGGLIGSMSSFGATARAWRNNRLGIQVGFTRNARTSDIATGRVTSMQFEPGVLYGLFDHVSDYVWIRPYVGSVVSFRHQTLNNAPSVALEPISLSGVGFTAFGGTEVTFASVPRFGLSADIGYRRFRTSFPGFEAEPISVSIAGHWYIK
jgi:hypothetical protein